MPVNYAQVKKMFLEALEQPTPKQRLGFIEEACGTDVELRNFVLGVLDVHLQYATPVPQGPTVFDSRAHVTTGAVLLPGSILGGKYKIIEQIAQGGMGSVYRASRIADMKMEVAIKVIKPGMDSQQVLARFNIERQALAMMNHENIARVFDAGMTDHGLPFVVMELVKGLNLTRFCDENKLSIDQRLDLFEQICSAIQHAHQKGIVHRDLKPSNIIVALFDDKPIPKVIDFGLAKALHHPLTDDDVKTKFGTFVGTWQYTAPEQAQLNNLDIDTRADIYSLGVILYELLTGTTPLESRRLANVAYDEVLKIIREEEPLKPSTKIHSSEQLPSIAALRGSEPIKLEKQVRGDLDWIVMKALEKNRNRRYATAHELAEDIRRLRHHEPVMAGPPTFSYRASKYLRKHWGKVLIASLLLSAIAIGAVVSTIGWVKAAQENQRANTQTEIAEAVNDFLKELLSEADPGVQIKPGQKFVSNITVTKAIDRSVQLVGQRFQFRPPVEAAIRHTIGKTYLGLGDVAKARLQLELAEQIRLKQFGPNQPERLDSLYELGWLYLLDSKLNLAEPLLKEALERRQATLGPLNPATLQSKYAIGVLCEYQDKPKEALQIFESVLTDQKKILTLRHRDTLCTQRELASVQQTMGELNKAETLLLEVLSFQNESLGKSHPETLTTLNNLALILDEKKEYPLAEKMMKELIETSEKILGPENPTHLTYQVNLASVYQSQKKYTDAITLLKYLVPKMKQVLGQSAIETLASLSNLAAILQMQGQSAEAEPLMVEAYLGCRSVLGENHEKTKLVLENLIEVCRQLGKQDKVNHYQEELKKINKQK